MGSYVPSTDVERQEMLKSINMSSFEELYHDVPKEMLLEGCFGGGNSGGHRLDIPSGKSEMQVSRAMRKIADKNRLYRTILRGAGAYDHYIPAIVKSVPAKEEFLTAYTPYQAEMSQGVLRSIFEYQTMICELTGMDVSNASVYDGATATAEAAAMCRTRTRRVTLVSATTNPEVINTLRTYAYGSNDEVYVVPGKEGRTDAEALKNLLGENTASFIVQQPNFYGQLEDCEALGKLVHDAGAAYVMNCNPIALGLLKTPAECGADVAVGEGQPLGLELGFGGPYLGYMATTAKLMRQLPGRIVGETTDSEGNRAYVLSLQAREQHIRREKAGSNICSNEALCALTASVYMAVMGPDGMREVASQCLSKAHFLAEKLAGIEGVRLAYPGEFFHEFVTLLPEDGANDAGQACCDASPGQEGAASGNSADRRETAAVRRVLDALDREGILGGLPVRVVGCGKEDQGGTKANAILWCVTEKAERAELERTVQIVRDALR
ncbi:MAG: aminomethyl-transferring glycine dehydrogenase subunit GcvPA [Lachnospiraceae bacterium]|nr:aminomethyl-transferring glycine dehydrogenase subunit GcvPA [Lachnospiraceae bacterium]